MYILVKRETCCSSWERCEFVSARSKGRRPLWRHPPGPLPSIYRASRCRRPTAQDAARQHKIQCAAPYTISPALDARLRDAVSLLASYGPRLRYATWPRSRHRLRPGQPADHVRWSTAYGRVWWPQAKEAAAAAVTAPTATPAAAPGLAVPALKGRKITVKLL
jgi:hypothetical protein